MCGILGAVGRQVDALSDSALVDALDLICHRGPDAGGAWRGAGIVLGHRRLSIIDLDPRAGQPMARGDLVVAFNGEIYNYRSLKTELSGLGYAFETTSDTEVLLAAWRQWGRACLSRLEGMFAFAIWDKAERCLTLVRDRYGEKPLFWLEQDGQLMFGSEVPPLVRLREGRLTEDAAAIGLFFLFSYIPAPLGAFRGLRQLEPGCWLEWRAGAVTSGRYYDIRQAVAAVQGSTDYPTAVQELRQRVTAAVRLRLETADVPVATLLSGGIDSSIVTTVAAGIYQHPLAAYSLGFPDDPDFDESDYARSVAARLPGIRHHVVAASEGRILDFAQNVFDHLGEPFADASLLPTAFLCSHVEEKVALGGDAADELFAGYGTYPAIVRGTALPALLRRLLVALPRHGHPHAIANPRLRAAALFHYHLRNDPVDSYISWRTYAELGTLARLGIDTTALAVVRERIGAASSGDLRSIQELDLVFNLPNDMLKKVDYAAMYHSLEIRLPYLDSGLVSWTLGLPDHFRLQGAVRKRILRDAFAADLPEQILSRRKMGFLLPIRRWFRGGRLRDELAALLQQQGRLDTTAVDALLARHAGGAEDNSVLLWALYVYLRWQANIGQWAAHVAPAADRLTPISGPPTGAQP